jgi:NADPH:quinone reductase
VAGAVHNSDYHRRVDQYGAERSGRTALVEEKKVRPLLDESHFTLETAPDAYRRLASGKARGKVVIDMAAVSRSTPE